MNLLSTLIDQEKEQIQVDLDYVKGKYGVEVMYGKNNVWDIAFFTHEEIAEELLRREIIDEIDHDHTPLRMYKHDEEPVLNNVGEYETLKRRSIFLQEDIELTADILKSLVAAREVKKDLARKVTGNIWSVISNAALHLKSRPGRLFT